MCVGDSLLTTIIFGVIAFVFVSWLVMTLWNFTLPNLWPGKVPEIDIYQAGAILILFRLLRG